MGMSRKESRLMNDLADALNRGMENQRRKRKAALVVVAYLRVSGKGQVDGTGFDRQLDAITAWAKRAGATVERVYREEGVSGTLDESHRPQFAAMVEDLLSNGCRTVVVESLDRFARDLSVQMQGIFSELDKNLLVRKLRKGRQKRREETGKCEGRPFFGQKPGEAETLARIKELYRKPRVGERMSLQEIADSLNKELDKYPTRVRRADGTIRPWSKGTIHAIVRRGFKVPETPS